MLSSNPIWKQKQNPGQRGNNSYVLEDEAELLGDLEKVYRLIFSRWPQGRKNMTGKKNEMNLSKYHL